MARHIISGQPIPSLLELEAVLSLRYEFQSACLSFLFHLYLSFIHAYIESCAQCFPVTVT